MDFGRHLSLYFGSAVVHRSFYPQSPQSARLFDDHGVREYCLCSGPYHVLNLGFKIGMRYRPNFVPYRFRSLGVGQTRQLSQRRSGDQRIEVHYPVPRMGNRQRELRTNIILPIPSPIHRLVAYPKVARLFLHWNTGVV